MALSNIKLLSFDLDNTLYDNWPVIKLAEAKSQAFLQAEFLIQKQDFDYQRFVEYRHEVLTAEKQGNSTQRSQYDNLTLLRQNVLMKFCNSLSNAEQIAAQALEIFLDYRNRVPLAKEIMSMLRELRESFEMVSVTNGNCDASQLELADFFTRNYSPTQGYRAKPHPEMLNQVIENFNLHPDQVLHIGDRLDSDGLAAQQAGCQFQLFAPFVKDGCLKDYCNDFVAKFSNP